MDFDIQYADSRTMPHLKMPQNFDVSNTLFYNYLNPQSFNNFANYQYLHNFATHQYFNNLANSQNLYNYHYLNNLKNNQFQPQPQHPNNNIPITNEILNLLNVSKDGGKNNADSSNVKDTIFQDPAVLMYQKGDSVNVKVESKSFVKKKNAYGRSQKTKNNNLTRKGSQKDKIVLPNDKETYQNKNTLQNKENLKISIPNVQKPTKKVRYLSDKNVKKSNKKNLTSYKHIYKGQYYDTSSLNGDLNIDIMTSTNKDGNELNNVNGSILKKDTNDVVKNEVNRSYDRCINNKEYERFDLPTSSPNIPTHHPQNVQTSHPHNSNVDFNRPPGLYNGGLINFDDSKRYPNFNNRYYFGDGRRGGFEQVKRKGRWCNTESNNYRPTIPNISNIINTSKIPYKSTYFEEAKYMNRQDHIFNQQTTNSNIINLEDPCNDPLNNEIAKFIGDDITSLNFINDSTNIIDSNIVNNVINDSTISTSEPISSCIAENLDNVNDTTIDAKIPKKNKHPIISYGIILFTLDGYDNRLFKKKNLKIDQSFFEKYAKFFISKRRESFQYMEFIRGMWHNETNVLRLLSMMDEDERKRIVSHSFDELWNDLWVKTTKRGYDAAKIKYNSIKNRLPALLTKANDNYDISLYWGFPKGRKSTYNRVDREGDLECAIREFQEETTIPKKFITILDIDPYIENYTGTDGEKYRTVYFVAYCPSMIQIGMKYLTNRIRDTCISDEVGEIKWVTINDINNNKDKLLCDNRVGILGSICEDICARCNNYIQINKD
jgi:8-oxo-dGTP pyrophosphatase MutT (NUDIX family)